jgi:hypothetical protein
LSNYRQNIYILNINASPHQLHALKEILESWMLSNKECTNSTQHNLPKKKFMSKDHLLAPSHQEGHLLSPLNLDKEDQDNLLWLSKWGVEVSYDDPFYVVTMYYFLGQCVWAKITSILKRNFIIFFNIVVNHNPRNRIELIVYIYIIMGWNIFLQHIYL